ncbi:MAG TPA: UDP-N-acetylglucosamine--N-acetylmuramyl-(pentapeptide) pyrophosphoryl-undecaprenol N-acetylglucosamine transferase [Microthrixaceae bacterium]|nr:UDP-N-acetylglucosamine--N-acetylmuramyl-(pentapeptide) pyrophosphoryl-undecaprenol N-acetylglucosamine transferase [Microthrixaceae bacterium]
MTEGTWALVVGGGTAGHVLPGVTVAAELVRRGHSASSIHFVGAERGIESKIVPEAGFEITLLPGRGIQRKLTLANIGAAWGLIRAVFKALGLVRRRRPSVVLALGGFASFACSLAAVIWRVPLVVADQNARAGASNRIFGRFAKACAVPFADTDLPKRVVTGNPVREEILSSAQNADKDAARQALGLPADRTVIVAFAGSLGSRRLNEAVVGAVGHWAERTDLAVHHVIGTRDWDARPVPLTAGIHYQAVPYEERMATVLESADLAICRSGGTTVAELTVMGLPSVLVPLPIATRDHQRANASELVRVGGAVLVADDEFDSERLIAEVGKILDGPDGQSKLSAMAAATRGLGHPDAAVAVADLVELHSSALGR